MYSLLVYEKKLLRNNLTQLFLHGTSDLFIPNAHYNNYVIIRMCVHKQNDIPYIYKWIKVNEILILICLLTENIFFPYISAMAFSNCIPFIRVKNAQKMKH